MLILKQLLVVLNKALRDYLKPYSDAEINKLSLMGKSQSWLRLYLSTVDKALRDYLKPYSDKELNVEIAAPLLQPVQVANEIQSGYFVNMSLFSVPHTNREPVTVVLAETVIENKPSN